jgi:peptidoglycan/xylan/chitin deacetylase (PgdA/CDA1 family)
MAIPADVFEGHIKFIKDNFRVVTMTDGLDLIREGKPKGMYAAINLDDGYMDNYTYAFPVLKKYNLSATIFLVTDVIGHDHLFWWDEVFQIMRGAKPGNVTEDAYRAIKINDLLMNKKDSEIRDFINNLKKQCRINKEIIPNQMLGWKEIMEMAGSGISFGGQTKTHKNLCLLEDNEMREELSGSKLALEEKLGVKKIGFCYPYGKYDDRVKRIVRDTGFDYARTCIKGPNNKDIDRFLLRSIDASFVFNKALLGSSIAFHSLSPKFGIRNLRRGHAGVNGGNSGL